MRDCVAAAIFIAAALAAWHLTARAGAGAGARSGPVAPARPAPAPRPAGHPLVVLRRDHVVRAAPGAQAERIGSVSARRPLTRARTTLPLLGRTTTQGGGNWVHVRLPGRPNGHAGWISAEGTQRAVTHWRIAVRLSKRRVTVFHRGRVEGRFRAVVGQASTPTPRGRFFVEEALRVAPVGGPYALAASARSHVFQEFAGGDGQIALHGVTGISGALGTAVSHGCIRLSPRAIRWLARRIGPGVPLTIRS